MKKQNAYKRIRQGMREAEKELLAHMRWQDGLYLSGLMGSVWHNALDRLSKAKMVRFDKKKHRMVARKGARPVTAVVR